MIFTKSTKYAIRAIIFIASRCEEGVNCSIKDIARDLEIPYHFLTKILQRLTEAGILISTKGTNGGVRLNINPGQIYLMDIVKAVDAEYSTDECVLGFPQCDENNPCALHFIWQEPKREIDRILDGITINDVLQNNEVIKL